MDVPDSTAEIAQIDLAGVYTVNIDIGSPTVGGFELLGSAATVGIGNARALGIEAAQATINGTLVVNTEAGLSLTRLVVRDPALLLGGSGQIVLNSSSPAASPRAQIADAFSGQQAIVGPSLTIRGTGIISAGLENRGLITADVDGFELGLQTANKVNDGELRAEMGGILVLQTDVVQGPVGRIVADGGTVRLNDTVVGGELDASAGLAEVAVGNARLEGVAVRGPLAIENTRVLTVADGLTLEGELTINREGGISATRLNLDGDQTLAGTGTIVLNDSSPSASSRAQIADAFAGQTTTVGPDLTIRGSGIISAALANEGLITADDPGGQLALSVADKINDGQVRAENDGTLLVQTGLTQNAAGRVVADGGTVRLTSTISGGGVDASGGLLEVASGNGRLEGVALLRGPVEIQNARSLTVAGGLELEGTIIVNRDASISQTRLLLADSQQLTGDGEIFLNGTATPPSLRAAIAHAVSGLTVSFGPQLSITGNGTIGGANTFEGVLSPGRAGSTLGDVAAFSMNGPVTLTDTAQVRLQLAGRDAGESDRIVGSADFTLAGTLEATLIDGFEPDVCENFIVIEGRSIDGAFDTLVPPASSSNRRWRLFYTADSVELRLTCAADIDGDCELTLFDFLGFQNLFDAGSAEADFDGDGSLTLFDFLAFQNQFAAGCS